MTPARPRLFCDLPDQTTTIGEFQHAATLVVSGRRSISAIGTVLTGDALGRQAAGEITIFDSSGIAIQDLRLCRKLPALLHPAAG